MEAYYLNSNVHHFIRRLSQRTWAMKGIRWIVTLLLVACLGTIGHLGCSFLSSNVPSSKNAGSSGKGMICIYRIGSPDEYGTECKVQLSINREVVCTLAPDEYWFSLRESGEVSISVFVDFGNVEGRLGGASAITRCDVQANQVLYERVKVPKHKEEETKRPRGLVGGSAEEIKDCTWDGNKFSPALDAPEGASVIYVYRLSSPEERGPDYPSVIYIDKKRACTLRPGEYCACFSEALEVEVKTTLHREPLVDDGIPTQEAQDGSSCSVDGSPTNSFFWSWRPKKPGEVNYIRVIYSKSLDFTPSLLIEPGNLGEMTSCQPVKP